MPATPATRPSTATKTGLRPSATAVAANSASVGGNGGAIGLDVGAVPDADVVAVEPAGDPLPRDLDHVLHRPHDPERLPGRAAEGTGHGVRRLRLQVPRELERRVVALPARHRRPALGERPGLVEQDGVDLAEPLQGVGVLDEDARARGAQQRDGHGERHREPERAGTGDDEQGDDALERDGRARGWSHASAGDDGEHEQGLDEAPGREIGRPQEGGLPARAPPGRWPGARRRASARRRRRHGRRAGPRGSWRRHSPRRPPARASAAASPVRTALSSDERPERTTPSTGTSSPERTSTRSPGASAVSGTSTTGASGPGPVNFRANSRKAAPRRLSARSRAARWALRWTCRAPRRAATSMASESNQIGPLPRTMFHALAANVTAKRDRDGQVDVDDPGPEAGERRLEERARREEEHRDRDDEGEPAEEASRRARPSRSTRRRRAPRGGT